MRIRYIKISQWRHFENIKLQLEDNAGLVCIVGANGTGKSHLLELIASCAHRLGLSQGIEIPRGDPFSDPHSFSLQFYVAEDVSEAIDQGLLQEDGFQCWDRTLTIEDSNLPGDSFSRIIAGGLNDMNQSIQFASRVIEQLRRSKDVHFLSLDADRAYPKKSINFNEIAQAYEIDWEGAEYTRGRSFKTTTTLYDEWIKYFLARENQSGTRLMQEMRRAKKLGTKPPEFDDYFEGYATSLQRVLPHLMFTGVDSKKRTLLFDTTGLELSFDQLSGGEREIAFLIGQIDRFGLRQGLFLLDEPELHLNADLIRTWVDYLTGSVSTGQIWLATHSLEAVEAAGQQSTFVLERNLETRKVDNLTRLDARPVLSALSRAVGTPAFSITQLLFVFIEGEEGIGERERFRKLAGMLENVRFMECGSCNEVLRRVSSIEALANESVARIRICGVIDRDFRSDDEVAAIRNDWGVYVLPVHEVENFFIHPETLAVLLQQNGKDNQLAIDIIRAAADRRAGSWVFQNSMAKSNASSLPKISSGAKERAKSLTWEQLCSDQDTSIKSIVEASGYTEDNQNKLQKLLNISVNSFQRNREEADIWKICEGKQVLNDVAGMVGFKDAPTLVQAAFTLWERDGCQIPEELSDLRSHLESL
ncbi:MAG TPA: DUF4435 domain-containing protein [Gammaproteobacteria bacterium]|nr:DUF4435 domain-containing protein [Gammaproteobacteria bacterium]